MEISLEETEVIEDMLIDDLKIVQDTNLYRFTSDPVLLSRFATAKNGDVVADFCSGSGIVAMHYYAVNRKEKKNLSFVLFEMQSSLANLSKKSIQLNDFDNFKVENIKIQDLPKDYYGKFSLVLCNPPYERGGFDNQTYEKAVCRKEITVNLKEVCVYANKALKYGGRIALCHRADRLAEVIYTLKEQGLETKRLQFATANGVPYLIMVEAVKGGKPGVTLLPPVENK